jgi:hypothetical protein
LEIKASRNPVIAGGFLSTASEAHGAAGWKRWVTLALGKGNSMISRLDFNFRQVLTGMHKGLFFCQRMI